MVTFTRLDDGDVLPAAKINELQEAIEDIDVKLPLYDVRNFNASPSASAADNQIAFQACADQMMADGYGGTFYFEGHYEHTGTITFTRTGFLGGLVIAGAGNGSSLTCTADNEPIFVFDITGDSTSITFRDFRFYYSTVADVTKTDRALVGGSTFYNGAIQDIEGSGFHYLINLPSGSSTIWGLRIDNVWLHAFTGGVWNLQPVTGSPNNLVTKLYMRADDCVGPIFNGNAVQAEMYAVEINEAMLGPEIIHDTAGGKYTIGRFVLETGLYETADRKLFYVYGSTLVAKEIVLEFVVNAQTYLFWTNGNHYVEVDQLRTSFQQGAGGWIWVSRGGRVTLKNSPTIFDNDGTGVDYHNSDPYYALTDMGSSTAADELVVEAWNDSNRLIYIADANYSPAYNSERLIIYNTALTTDRTLTLPSGSLAFTGRAFTVYRTAAGAGSLLIKDQGGTTIATLTGKGVAELTWSRSLTNSPSQAWVGVVTTEASSHTHAVSDITALDEQIRDVVGTALVGGTNISVSINDAGDTITVNGNITSEVIRDTIGTMTSGTNGITVTHNDAADTLVISPTYGTSANTFAEGNSLAAKANLASPTFTGTVVLPTNQTLTTPTISSTGFTNAQHAHTGATSGGQLTDAALSTFVGVAKGGSGRASHGAYNLIAGGTSSTAAQQSISNGTSGQFLKSAGVGALPAFAGIAVADISDFTSSVTAHSDVAANTAARHNHSNVPNINTTTAAVVFVLNGNGSAIIAGQSAWRDVPFNCTITGWSLLADAVGSIAIDICKDTYANYPPVIGDAISGSGIAISADIKNASTTLTGWTTSVSAGDIIKPIVSSAATIKEVVITLYVTRT
jgi:hypothetical protein